MPALSGSTYSPNYFTHYMSPPDERKEKRSPPFQHLIPLTRPERELPHIPARNLPLRNNSFYLDWMEGMNDEALHTLIHNFRRNPCLLFSMNWVVLAHVCAVMERGRDRESRPLSCVKASCYGTRLGGVM